MIIRITFLDINREPFTMLFGDSYKKWLQQYQEYLWECIKWVDKTTLSKRELFGIEKVESSKAKWKGWGGLKWCPHKDFQKELNREGCQYKDPDNPHPRQYSVMEFKLNKYIKRIVRKLYIQRLRHLKAEQGVQP